MKFDRFDFLVWTVIAILTAAILGVYLIGSRGSLEVVRLHPVDGARVGAFSRVGITFDQPIDLESVEARFEITPPIEGAFRWQGETVWFIPAEPFQAQTAYNLELTAGATGAQGGEIQRDVSWRMEIREPSVLYLSEGEGTREIWRAYLDERPPERLTGSDQQIFDYTVSRDGETIVYSAINDEGGIDLWTLDRGDPDTQLLLDCGFDRCTMPAWSPDGLQIAYAREQAGLGPGDPISPARIWLIEPASGETTRLFANTQKLGFGPSWSPDGRRLAMLDSAARGIRILDLSTGEEAVLPSQLGAVGTWSPDEDIMLFTNMKTDGSRFYEQVYRADLNFQDIRAVGGVLSDESSVYSTPAWSPAGDRILVGMQKTDSRFGRQLWMMPPDAREHEPITDAPDYTHTRYAWDPWGDAVVYQRIRLATGDFVSEVLVWDRGTNESTLIAQNATMPAWSP